MDKAPEQMIVMPEKGEAPMREDQQWTKGKENPEETQGVFWVPFWDFFSGMFSRKEELPKPNNEVRMAKPVHAIKKPQRAEFDSSDEFLEELNTFHFGESESHELVDVDSHEARHANYKMPEHVRDAVLYNKVLPRRADFSDYGEFLEETNRHLMAPAQPKAKKTWFGYW